MKSMTEKAKRITLRFRVVDRKNFNEVKDGTKRVETRAATERYRNIKKGDVLIVVCGKSRITKVVKKAHHFSSITAMIKVIPMRKIMPSVSSMTELRKAYYSYPGYKEKIQRYGLVAWEI